MAVDGNQQNDVSELNTILASRENTNNDSEIGNNVVLDEAMAIDSSKPISPLKDGINVSHVKNFDFGNEAEGSDLSKMISPNHDVASGFGLSTCSNNELGMKDDGDDLEKINNDVDRSREFDDDLKMNSNSLPLENEIDESGIQRDVVDCETDRVDGLEVSFAMEEKKDSEGGIPSTLVNSEELKEDAKKSAELRERRRSKYLSPPYVNLNKGSKGSTNLTESETGNSGVSGQGEGNGGVSEIPVSSPLDIKTGTKSRRRKSSRKISALLGSNLEITSSSSQLLSELHLAALDCLYPFGNKLFDPTEVFFAKFRASVFHGGESIKEVIGKNTFDKNEEGNQIGNPNESKSRPEKRKREAKRTGSEGALTGQTQNLQVGNSTGSKRGRKKKVEQEKPIVGTSNVGPTGLFDVNVNVAENCKFSIDNYSTMEKVAAQVPEVPIKQTAFTIDFSQETHQTIPSSGNLSLETNQTKILSFESMGAVGIPDLNDQTTPMSIPGPKKRGRPKKVVGPDANASANSDGQPEKKKRRRRCKDGTYKDGLPAPSAMKNAKPISLEVCLHNVGPYNVGPHNVSPHTRFSPPNQASTPLRSMQPVNGSTSSSLPRTPGTPGDPPSIDQIKKQLEYMTAMIEKSGDNLNAETKANLQTGIQGLMKKVSAVPGSTKS